MTTEKILEIILNYITVVLSWPVIFFAISLIFICKFKKSIKSFLENIASIKVGPFEANQRQSQDSKEDIEDQISESLQQKGITLTDNQIKELENEFNNLTKEKEEKDAKIKNQSEIIKYLVERSEIYEFAYLSLSLVYNTKLALRWFYLQVSNSSTKENFMAQFNLPGQIVNPWAEKEAIFNALLTNGLLEQIGSLFKVSEKGIRFLRYVKLIV